jgi:peptide chain release factor 2
MIITARSALLLSVHRRIAKVAAFSVHSTTARGVGVSSSNARRSLPAALKSSSSRLQSSSNTINNNSNNKKGSASTVSPDQELSDTKRLVDQVIDLHADNLQSTSMDIPRLQSLIQSLEEEQADPDFYESANSEKASNVNKEISQYTRQLSRLKQWEQYKGDCLAALEMIADEDISSDERQMLLDELNTTANVFNQDLQRYQLELLLSGPYDAAPARLVISAGAGGTEANDFCQILTRMYERAATNMGFTAKIEDIQEGDVVGYKSVEMTITGVNAFGMMQGEKGAHRLVRLSPFNANNKRQTTFVGVDVAPDVFDSDDNNSWKDIEIPDADLEITFMRAGGKGGQNVNKVNSACRIKHLPTGLQVKCTQERSQPMNKDIAMKRLKVQLLAVAQEQRVQEIQEIRGDLVEASWGRQIRNYVLHPYKMIKDQRTGWESANAQAFLDGELLDDCIASYLRWKAEEEGAGDDE